MMTSNIASNPEEDAEQRLGGPHMLTQIKETKMEQLVASTESQYSDDKDHFTLRVSKDIE